MSKGLQPFSSQCAQLLHPGLSKQKPARWAGNSARKQEQPRLRSTEQRSRSPRKHILGSTHSLTGTQIPHQTLNRARAPKLVKNMEISPEEPCEGKQRLLTSVCRKGRTMAPQLPAAHRAEPHLRHLDLEWTPAEIHWNGHLGSLISVGKSSAA